MEDSAYQPKSIFNRHTILRGVSVGLTAYLGAMIFAVVFLAIIIHNKYQLFLFAAEMSHGELVSLAKQIDSNKFVDQTITFLILGVDDAQNRPNFPQLTDTMLLTQISPDPTTITLLSFPRDLWHEPYKTKINALYEYGKERYPGTPEQFPQEVIQELTDLEIDYTLAVSLAHLSELIDLVGGITVEVEEGFIDEFFPREDVDILTERDPAQLYETVEFQPGTQEMDGATALKYIRSRHSLDQKAGNDLARSQRQQQVFQALLLKLSQPQLYWQRPEVAGLLLRFYHQQFEQYLPLTDVAALAISLARQNGEMQFNALAFSVYPDEPDGLLEHPRDLRPFQNQWVYVMRNQSEFKNYIQQHFKNN